MGVGYARMKLKLYGWMRRMRMDAEGNSWLNDEKLDSSFLYTADSRNRRRFLCLHFPLFAHVSSVPDAA